MQAKKSASCYLSILCAWISWLHVFPATAETINEIGWSDLIPASAKFEDPFKPLTGVQISDLAMIAEHRQRISAGVQVTELEIKQVKAAEQYLIGKGIGVEGLLARRSEIQAKRRAALIATDSNLHDQRVRLPGYMLPLEFDGNKVTDFLLVPFVGACIHVPPPPANQIVFIRYEAGYENSVLFSPVWVQGLMQVGSGSHELYLTDGSADISAGYRMQAEEVVEYTQ